MSKKPKGRIRKMDNSQRPLPTDLPPPQALPAPADQPLPAAPATPAPAAAAYPEPGTHYMAKSPAFNGNWEVCQILANPNDPQMPLVVFPDGTQYTADSVQIGGRVGETTEAQPAPGYPQNAAVATPGLNPNFESLKSQLVALNTLSMQTFSIPLDVLLTMVQRYALKAGLNGSGKMAIYGGLSQFVPDDSTFNNWAEAYMLEIQRRSGGNGPEV